MRFYATIGLLSFCAIAWPQQPANDAKALDGKWLVASAELGGNPFPEDVTKKMVLTLTGGKYAFTEGKTPDQGNIKIDASMKLKTMDITGTEGPNNGKTYLAIYDLQGDTLRICYDLSGKARPSEFATKKGSLLFLVTYHRAK